MTIIDGMPVSQELANFLKEFCPNEKGAPTYLTGCIGTISDVQDFVTMKLGGMDEKEKCEVANYLNDIVSLKKDLIKLSALLPIITGGSIQ